MMVEGLDPAFAMKLKQAAGHESATPSLAYIAAQAAGIDPEAMEGEALQITPGSIQSTPRRLLMKRPGFLRRWMQRPKPRSVPVKGMQL